MTVDPQPERRIVDSMSSLPQPTPRRDVSPDELMGLIGAARAGTGPHDLLIYLHVPFCSSKCHFCDFVADLAVPDLISGANIRARYVSALCRQITEYAPRLAELGYRPRLVYWGGGTPSRLAADELGQVATTVSSAFDLSNVEEHSFESSPETLTLEKVQTLRRCGVNRISIGVQSFVEEELRRAGRSHSAEQAEEAARAVRQGGIDNLNLDLIVAFPGQTRADTRHSLERCIAVEPTHVTVYPYRADPRTIMARQIGRGLQPELHLADLVEAFELSRDLLARAGYVEYALGHFARDGYRFRGESYYFDLGGELAGDFIGFGSGAGSSLGHYAASNSHRTFDRYRDDPLTIECCERYSPYNLGIIGKTVRLALLNWSGINYARFEQIFGFPFAALRAEPTFAEYFTYFRMLGAEFIEDEVGIRLTERSQLGAHLRSYAQSPEYIYERQDPGPSVPRQVRVHAAHARG
jgi:coproporphyrinogen III oxidase-like Fe-S oxidoreductase